MLEVRALAGAQTGTVTFLFTDLEASTRLWELAPDPMAVAVASHDRILRDAVAVHGGRTFKDTGDGLCAAFDDPVGSVGAALEAQRALRREVWPDEIDALRVRMAVHSGTAQPYGDDYRGPALNRVARLMAAGHGGQILISSAAAQLQPDRGAWAM